MFQKELGEKIVGKFKTSNYGRLSILSNLRLKTFNKFLVSPNCFFQDQKVTSMVIHFKPRKQIEIKLKILKILRKLQIFYFQIKEK